MTTRLDYHKLTAAERLAWIAEIQDSLESRDVNLADAEHTELDCGRDDLDFDSISGIPWEQVRMQRELHQK